MWLSRYVCLFMIYSLMGWVYESIFCTIKGGKWEKRGFLYGPICPIYGVGAVLLSGVILLAGGHASALNTWQIILLSAVGSAILEYATSWALERLFHALWWDYSDVPLNLHGRISFFSSLGFGFAGLLIARVIAPFAEGLMDEVSPILTELLSLLLLSVFIADLTLTVTALLHFDQMVQRAEENFNQNMDLLVDGAARKAARIKEGISEKGRQVSAQARALGWFFGQAVGRVHQFRDRDKKKETVQNRLLAAVRQIPWPQKNTKKHRYKR